MSTKMFDQAEGVMQQLVHEYQHTLTEYEDCLEEIKQLQTDNEVRRSKLDEVGARLSAALAKAHLPPPAEPSPIKLAKKAKKKS